MIILFILFVYVIDFLGGLVKRGIFYEALINYAVEKNEDMNIDYYTIGESKVNGDYSLMPLNDNGKDIVFEYYYSFYKKILENHKELMEFGM